MSTFNLFVVVAAAAAAAAESTWVIIRLTICLSFEQETIFSLFLI
jgi:hypothetical protein